MNPKLYINPKGIVCYIADCPKEPKRWESGDSLTYNEAAWQYYKEALAAAKESAISLADPEDAYLLYEVTPDTDDHKLDTIHPFPEGYSVEVMDAQTARIFSTGDSHKRMPLRGKVAVITPLKEHSKVEGESQEERVPVYSTPDGKLYIKPEELFALKRVQGLILKISNRNSKSS